jgi:hypothetical protein
MSTTHFGANDEAAATADAPAALAPAVPNAATRSSMTRFSWTSVAVLAILGAGLTCALIYGKAFMKFAFPAQLPAHEAA